MLYRQYDLLTHHPVSVKKIPTELSGKQSVIAIRNPDESITSLCVINGSHSAKQELGILKRYFNTDIKTRQCLSELNGNVRELVPPERYIDVLVDDRCLHTNERSRPTGLTSYRNWASFKHAVSVNPPEFAYLFINNQWNVVVNRFHVLDKTNWQTSVLAER